MLIFWQEGKSVGPMKNLIGQSREANKPQSTYNIKFRIDHFTVSCLVARPPNESEAGANPVLTEKLTAFLT